jgi:hypothetical protein
MEAYGLNPRDFGRIWWRYIVGLGIWILLGVCIWALGPAWSAHLNHGQRGTWTVTRIACGKYSCNPIGRFVSDDGTDVRDGILMDGNPVSGVGASFPAVDTGGDVAFPPAGGARWWLVTLATTLLSVLCLVWIWTFPLKVIRRRRRSRLAGQN